MAQTLLQTSSTMLRHQSDAVALGTSAADDPLPDLDALAERLQERSFLFDDPGCYEAGVAELHRAIVVARAKRAHPAGSSPAGGAPLRAAPPANA